MAGRMFVEIEVNKDCQSRDDEISEIVRKFLRNKTLIADMEFYEENFRSFPMRANIRKIVIATDTDPSTREPFQLSDYGVNVEYFVYRLNFEDYAHAEIADDAENAAIVASTCFNLPHNVYQNLWKNLIYDSNVKNEMLSYCETMMLFSLKNVDISVITSNRLAMFHGPPGSGKTSLCKALAQKLSIRLSKHYTNFKLLEINSHSLFSKYFSESAKIVMKLFDLIRVILSESRTLAIVLIDEVESLVKNRMSSMASAEPGDSLRVVNAILTQMDSIKTFPNVLVLTTSNMADQVDPAFLDRVDFKKFIDAPSENIAYRILRSCIIELQEKGLVGPGTLDPSTSAANNSCISSKLLCVSKCVSDAASIFIVIMTSTVNITTFDLLINWKVLSCLLTGQNCNGVSGRSLRKLPMIAYALLKSAKDKVVSIEDFIDSLNDAIQQVQDGSKVGESISISVPNETDVVKAELMDSECQTDRTGNFREVENMISTLVQCEPEAKLDLKNAGFQTEICPENFIAQTKFPDTSILRKNKYSISQTIVWDDIDIDLDSDFDGLF